MLFVTMSEMSVNYFKFYLFDFKTFIIKNFRF